MQGHSHILLRAGNEFGVDFVLHPGASMKISTQDGTGDVIIRNSSNKDKAIIADVLLEKISKFKTDSKEKIEESLDNREHSRHGGWRAGLSLTSVLFTTTLGVMGGGDPAQAIGEALDSVPQNTLKLLGAYKEIYTHAKTYEKLENESKRSVIINLE
jgi:hypothetical protein